MSNLCIGNTSIYALPDLIIQMKSPDIIWSPSLLQAKVENVFNIPIGGLWTKTRSPQFAIARYTFLNILQLKFGMDPALIRIIYGLRYDTCWQARHVIEDILKSKTPRHYYIKIEKLNLKVRKWDLTEISQKLELLFADNATVPVQQRSILTRSMAKALFTTQLNARLVTDPEELTSL